MYTLYIPFGRFNPPGIPPNQFKKVIRLKSCLGCLYVDTYVLVCISIMESSLTFYETRYTR